MWGAPTRRFILDPAEVRGSMASLDFPARRVDHLNVYGPTEATTFTSWHLVEEVPAGATTIPIGRPISNTEVYILDRHMAPVPIGVPGELCIGEPGLARGYLRRSELTAERFVPHAFSAAVGARLYRTGDLARWRPNGSVEYIGRLDEQVKIRGHRVEPGEVETALGRHPSVRQSVVLAREQTVGGRRLVAYVVADEGAPPAAEELRTFLRRTLPEWMVPAAFVFLRDFPLTPNGSWTGEHWHSLRGKSGPTRGSSWPRVTS